MGLTTRNSCIELVEEYHFREHRHPLGPSNRSLYDLATEVLRQERALVAGEGPGTPENILISLVNEIRGVSASSTKTAPSEWAGPRSPREWQKFLDISGTTWRRWHRTGKLMVDQSISKRSVFIRQDTLDAVVAAKAAAAK